MEKGLFITFEGTDGCGKTTQINKVKSFLTSKGYEVVVTREPGALDIGQKIRDILLYHEGTVSDRCEMFLFLADRSQHVDTFIKPYLEAGKIVLCDRYTDSTIAYQGFGRERDINLLKELNDIATGKLMPDLTFLYDVSIETAQKRLGDERDRMESIGTDFDLKVRNGYKRLSEENPDRIKMINAEQPIEKVYEETISIISELLDKRSNK